VTKSELICRLQRIVFDLYLLEGVSKEETRRVSSAIDELERLVDDIETCDIDNENDYE
jgi:hypothetical protein